MFNQYSQRSRNTMNRHMGAMANHVTNINNTFTTGYKAKSMTFHETIGGLKARQQHDFRSGAPEATGRELDFAIDGLGFFEVKMPDGSLAYTRAGSMQVNAEGVLISAQGFPISDSTSQSPVASEDGSFKIGVNETKIRIPTGASVQLLDDGTLIDNHGQRLGELTVYAFPNIDGLRDAGDGLYTASQDSGMADKVELGFMAGDTKIKQGYTESSNANIVESMSRVQQLNTAIKAEMKVLKALDQLQENLNQTISRNI